jgi:hypothetical protein
MLPLIGGLSLDTYLIARLILRETTTALLVSGVASLMLLGLWYGLPAFCRTLKK